jgi:hypothetical protein
MQNEAKITSLRKVDWGSMHANFFVMYPVSSLPDVPVTYMGAFRAPEKGFDNALVRSFPNVTNVDMSATINQVQRVLDQVIRAVEFLFGFTLAAGLVVLFAAVTATREERAREFAIMRAVGARASLLRQVQRAELVGVGLLAGFLASIVASVVGWALARYVFEFTWTASPLVPVAGALAGAVLALGAGWWGCAKCCAGRWSTRCAARPRVHGRHARRAHALGAGRQRTRRAGRHPSARDRRAPRHREPGLRRPFARPASKAWPTLSLDVSDIKGKVRKIVPAVKAAAEKVADEAKALLEQEADAFDAAMIASPDYIKWSAGAVKATQAVAQGAGRGGRRAQRQAGADAGRARGAGRWPSPTTSRRSPGARLGAREAAAFIYVDEYPALPGRQNIAEYLVRKGWGQRRPSSRASRSCARWRGSTRSNCRTCWRRTTWPRATSSSTAPVRWSRPRSAGSGKTAR